ncbi:acyltransferase domain-containing protein, partial [Mycobacterium simulans]|uniref:acyltransferase domain-containing protein n=1 Tax=Mycobacterium simulans TaxID=627089 RepID=UPI00174CA161
PWPVTDHPRTAAVSSFGISGTNAHLIVQQAPDPALSPTPLSASTLPLPVWPISARTPAALAAYADRLHQQLIDHPDLDLIDVAYSLATTRTHHPYRAAITAPAAEDVRAQLLVGLEALRDGRPHPHLAQHHLTHQGAKIVFVLPGQGAQHPGMGAQLYAQHDAFADTFDEVSAAFDAHLEIPLRDVIFAEPDSASAGLLTQTAYAQPALFAYGVAMHAVLADAGITPDILMGHSIGELTAAHLAGVLSLEDAAILVSARGRLMQACAPGAMLAIQATPEDIMGPLAGYPNTAFAAINSPTSIVIAGPFEDIDQLREHCSTHGYKTTPLTVSHAFHSPAMDPALAEFEAIAASLTFYAPGLPVVSNLTGQLATPDQLTSPDYWTQHLRHTVRFADSVAGLLAADAHTFVELSPHPVLAPAITDTSAGTGTVITTAHRDRPNLDTLTAALAHLHTHGHSPNWPTLLPHARTTALPTYPFQHRRYWLPPATHTDVSTAGLHRPNHPLLGAVTPLADPDQVMVLTGRLSSATHSWLAAHRVNDTAILPATGFVDLLLYAGEQAACATVDELVLHAPLTLSDPVPVDLQITVQPVDDTQRRQFTVHSSTADDSRSGTWVLNATGAFSATTAAAPPSMTTPLVEAINSAGFYDQLATECLQYHPPFQGVVGIGHDSADPDTVYAEIALPPDTDVGGYSVHPALLDAALHPLSTLEGGDDEPAGARLPFALAGITLYATGATRLYVRLNRTSADTYTLHAADPTGAPVISIAALTLRALPETIPPTTP